MVYDRGRAVRDSHEGSQFESSGSPRPRFLPNTSNYTQKSGPARPHAASSSDVADNNVPGIKLLIELVSERVFWYIQRDNADKKCKKWRQDVKRCHNGDFSSAADLLDIQSKAADLEKAKFSQRMTAIDDKLVDATSAWWSKLETATQSIHENNRHNPTPPPSETSVDIQLSIEEKTGHMRDTLEASMRKQITEEIRKLQCAAKEVDESRTTTLQSHTMRESQKLAQLRDSLEASLQDRMEKESQKLQCEIKDEYESRTATIQTHAMQESQKLNQMRLNLETVIRRQSAEESQKLQSKIKDQYEAQIAALNQDLVKTKQISESLQGTLSREQEVSKSLQAELKSTNARLAALETQIEGQAKKLSRSDRSIKQKTLVDLESRLAKVEVSQMATKKSESTDAVDDPKSDSKTNAQTRSMDRVLAQDIYLELEVELMVKLEQFVLQSGDRIVPDERVLRVVQPNISALEAHLQSSLKRIGDSLGAFIDKERDMRESLGVQVEAAATASAAAIQDLKSQFSASQTTSDATHQSDAAASKNQQEQLQKLTTSLASTKREIESVMSELQKSVNSLWLRSMNMHAWQENFSTPKLFDAIAQHLNLYFIPEHLSALTNLKARIAGIEGQLYQTDGSYKKRKLGECSSYPPPSLIKR